MGAYSFSFCLEPRWDKDNRLLVGGYKKDKKEFRGLLEFCMDQAVTDLSLLCNNGFYGFLLGEDLRKKIYELNQETSNKKLELFNKFKEGVQKVEKDAQWYKLKTKFGLRSLKRYMPTLEREVMKLGMLTWDDAKRMNEIIGSECEELDEREGRSIIIKNKDYIFGFNIEDSQKSRIRQAYDENPEQFVNHLKYWLFMAREDLLFSAMSLEENNYDINKELADKKREMAHKATGLEKNFHSLFG